MNLLSRFHVLKTASSEVNKKTLFKNRYTTHIPDLFFALCFAFSLFAAQSLDKVFVVLLFFCGHSLIGAGIFATFVFVPSACLFCFEKNQEDCMPGYTMRSWCSTILILLGCGPFLICGNALKNSFKSRNGLNFSVKHYSIPIFHLKNKDMCLMKIYYIFNVAVKCIPQFYIVSILVMEGYITGALAILGEVSLLFNMVIFSLTMAMTFPLRSTPRVYTTSFCVLFNAFCKFMATLCGCGINLAIFTMLFANIGYYALVIHTIRSLLWIWPSWWVLTTQPYVLTQTHLIFYLFFLTLIFSFIYIHPFEGKGKLVYYFFYLMKFCIEIFCIYALTDANSESISIYFTLEAVMIGFLSCYGLVNILHKYKSQKFGCEWHPQVQYKREKEKKIHSTEQKNVENRDELQMNLRKSNVNLEDAHTDVSRDQQQPQTSGVGKKSKVDIKKTAADVKEEATNLKSDSDHR